jgi:hypothetical protein
VDSIVLDLRGNGGGLLQGAVDTAALFLPPGKTINIHVYHIYCAMHKYIYSYVHIHVYT